MRTRWSVSCFALLCVAAPVCAGAIEWPQEVEAPEGKIIVYQPQPERLTGNQLTGRAAMSLELKGKAEPVFGAFWFTARIDTDQDEGTATVRDVKVTQVRWPDSKDAGEARFTKLVQEAIPATGFEISLERLSASLATAQREQQSLAALKNDPPKIVFSEGLAVLLFYDGEPRFAPIDKSPYERALNTPFAVARDTKSKRVYLSSGKLWYVAGDPKGPFAATQAPPADLAKMLPAAAADEPTPKVAPKIVVATAPTELIATDGKPSWKSLPGGKLLYVTNTETVWLRDLADQQMYVLLSGRWFRARSQSGPWSFVRPDQLPASLKDIPPDSDVGGVRASIAGTEEAQQAVLDAEIPQTAAIKRSEAKLQVQYDGAPKFEKIAGTSVAYAVNTGTQVLEIDKRYYAVDNGVWFTSTNATGPWSVADKVPQEQIAKIPPSAPVYNVTYVTVYDSTPEVVYVGYRPGYLWAFPYYGVPVYGTGWYYPPYWGTYYYPRPPTWGLHVGYNPWTGWSYGVSWSNGFLTVGVGWNAGWPPHHYPVRCCSGWYGGGYRRPVFINTGDINIGNSINVGNRTNIGNQLGNSATRDRVTQNNLYKQPQNRTRVADRTATSRNVQQARAASGRENNVFADKSGTVARRAGDSWETREQGQWKAPTAETREGVQSNSIDRNDLGRAHSARQAGASREGMRAGGLGRRR